MARTYASPTGAALSSGGVHSVAIPTPSTHAGKVCFIAITQEGVSTNTFATPTGWNVIKSDRSSTIQALGVFWRVLQSGDASTVDFTTLNTTGTQASISIAWVDDEVDPAGPIDQVSAVLENTATAATSLTLNAITAGSNKNLYAVYGSSDNATGSTGTGTGRASFTHDSATMSEEIDADTDAGGDVAIGISYQANVSGSTGNKTVVGTPASTSNYRVVGILFSVNPAPSNTPKAGTDSGTGSDSASVEIVELKTATDANASVTETPTVEVIDTKSDDDSATGTDSATVSISETKTGSESLTAVEVESFVEIDDSAIEGTGTDVLNAISNADTVTESATDTEVASLEISVSDSQTGTTEEETVETFSEIVDDDSAIGADAFNALETLDELAATDSSTGSDASTLESANSTTDDLTGSESVSVDNSTSTTDDNDSVDETAEITAIELSTTDQNATADDTYTLESLITDDDISSAVDELIAELAVTIESVDDSDGEEASDIDVAGAVSTEIIQLSLDSAATPEVRTGHALTVRARILNSSHSAVIRIQLFENVDARSTVLETDELTDSFADYVLPIDEADAETITDYTNLSVVLYGHSEVGDPAEFEISEVSLEIPLGITEKGGSDSGTGDEETESELLFEQEDDGVVTEIGNLQDEGNPEATETSDGSEAATLETTSDSFDFAAADDQFSIEYIIDVIDDGTIDEASFLLIPIDASDSSTGSDSTDGNIISQIFISDDAIADEVITTVVVLNRIDANTIVIEQRFKVVGGDYVGFPDFEYPLDLIIDTNPTGLIVINNQTALQLEELAQTKLQVDDNRTALIIQTNQHQLLVDAANEFGILTDAGTNSLVIESRRFGIILRDYKPPVL
jgi:hypothetical protein